MTSFNITSLIDAAAIKQPDKTAIIHFEKGAYRHYLYQDLLKDSNAYAQNLRDIGLKKGSSVALLLKPNKDFFVFTLALLKAGLVPVFLDPAIGLKRLKACLKDANIDVFVGSFGVYVASFLFDWRKPQAKHIFPPFTNLKQPPNKSSYKPFQARAEDTAAIIFTSGSTGPPKGVVYTHENLMGQLTTIKTLYDISEADVDLPTLPVFTFLDLAFGLTSVLANTNTLRPAKAEPEKLLEAIERFGVTSMFASPVLIDKFASYGQENKIKLPPLKRVISAGAPATPESLKKFKTLLEPRAEIFTPYGATECLPISSIASTELFDTMKQSAQGAGVCVGKPVKNLDMRIIHLTDDPIEVWRDELHVPQGEIGEIVVKAKQVTKRYLEQSQANTSAKIKDADGIIMHRMGDLGYLDEQGRLWFVGRKTQRVQLENETLYTIPIERIFNEHPKVKRTALVGAMVKEKLEPVLCVELEQEVTKLERKSILKDLEERARLHPKTKRIKMFLFHKKLPVDVRHNSKIKREQLAHWAQAQLNNSKLEFGF